MYRIFKQPRDLAARGSEGRPRRPRRQRPGLEALEGRQLLSLSPGLISVNTNSAGNQSESDVASSTSGSVVVWTTPRATGSGTDIHAQMFFPDGTKKGSDMVLNNFSDNNHHPRVAMNSSGEFVVVWEDDGFFPSPGGPYHQIEFKTFDSTGKVFNAFQHELEDGTSTGVFKRDPDVAMDLFGNFVISYTEDVGTTDRNVRAVEYDRNFNRLSLIDVGVSTVGDENSTSVAIPLDNTGFDIAYQFQPHGSSQAAIVLNQYGSNGQLIPNGSHLISNSTDSRNPSVATDHVGNAVVVYERFVGNDFDIKAMRVSTSGAVGSEIPVRNTGAQETRPAVAVSPTGGAFVVAYNTDLLGAPPGTNRTVEVREFNSADTPVLGFNLPALPNNSSPALSINRNGGYQLTYTSGVGADQNITMQLGQLPVAPAAQNLALTSPIQVGHRATLSGQLVDGDGDTNLTLTVDWGDGSKPKQSQPGLDPFAVKHKYRRAGTYTVHATWTDSTGLSNSRDLTIVVTRHRVKSGSQAQRRHRA
jgi:hypothetical protein